MKKLLSLLALCTAPLAATASAEVDLQGTVFTVDTLRHYFIADGVTQSVLHFHNGSRGFHASVTDLDKTKARNTVPQVIIGRDSCNTAETVSTMARRHTTATRQVLAGMNGDFFITSGFSANHELGNAILGYPNTTCIIDSRIAAPDIIDIGSRENVLCIAGDNMYIDATDLRYRLLNNDGSTVVDAFAANYPRRDDQMIIYNSFAGKYTSTSQTGRELTLRLAPGAEWAINKSVKFIVEGSWRQGGCSPIPEDGIVISCGPQYENAFIDGLGEGDIVKMKIVCTLPAFGVKPQITDAIGGDVRILNQGTVTTEAIRWINTPTAQYSRAMAGYDKDRTHLVLCTVDAGSLGNSGVTYFEGADLMKFLGCYDALDLDGGGSTEMWSASHGIVNTLRDGSERAVANGIFITLNAPADDAVTSIRFADYKAVLPKYGLYKPVIYGYNRYGQLVSTNVEGCTLSAPEALGEVRDNGSALLASGTGTHLLTATLDGMTATVAVTIETATAATATVNPMILDKYHSWDISLTADVNGTAMAIDPRAYTWTSDNPLITVDANGRVSVTGHGIATANITGTSGESTVSFVAIAECPPGIVGFLESAKFDPTTWKLTGNQTSGRTITAMGSNWAIDFKVTGTRGPQVTASKKLRVWGIPEELGLTITTGENAPSKITLSTTAASTTTPVKTEFTNISANSRNSFKIPLTSLCDVNDAASYPLTFNSMRFDCKKTGDYHIEVIALEAYYYSYENSVDNISVDHATDKRAIAIVDDDVIIPVEAETLSAYDLTGRLVATAHNSSTLSGMPSGLYIITATTQGKTLSAKLRK